MEYKYIKGRGAWLSSLPCLIFVLLLTACGPEIEYREVDTDGVLSFEIKTDKGCRSWGMVSSTIDNSTGKRYRYLPCEYDSIYKVKGIKYLYMAMKDGKTFAYNRYGSEEFLFEGKPVEKIILSNDLYRRYSNSTDGNLYNQAHTREGIYFFREMDLYKEHDFCFGPYENFFYGFTGYAYKKNGKWGVLVKKTIDLTPGRIFNHKTEVKYIPFLPAVYDAAIEIIGPQSYWLVKENGDWKTILTSTGEEIKKPQSLIQLLLKRPILKSENYCSDHYTNDLDYGYKRIGGEEYGAIRIRDKYRAY